MICQAKMNFKWATTAKSLIVSSRKPQYRGYLLVLGLYSKILNSKKLVDFYMAEYSLEITLKEKLQTRLARTRKSSFE